MLLLVAFSLHGRRTEVEIDAEGSVSTAEADEPSGREDTVLREGITVLAGLERLSHLIEKSAGGVCWRGNGNSDRHWRDDRLPARRGWAAALYCRDGRHGSGAWRSCTSKGRRQRRSRRGLATLAGPRCMRRSLTISPIRRRSMVISVRKPWHTKWRWLSPGYHSGRNRSVPAHRRPRHPEPACS